VLLGLGSGLRMCRCFGWRNDCHHSATTDAGSIVKVNSRQRTGPKIENGKSRNCARLRGLVGARRPIVEELLSWAEEYPIEWREPRVDLAELARLRWIEGMSQRELAERYGRTEFAIGNYFQNLRRKDFRVPGLSPTDRKSILKQKNRFCGRLGKATRALT
jgi:hypothetical protein